MTLRTDLELGARSTVRRVIPLPARQRLRRLLRRPVWGNTRRYRPFSSMWGFDRGMPADRYYLHSFMSGHADDIRGAVCEVQAPVFASRHGREVRSVDIIDINPSNSAATVLADLAVPSSLPAGRFDCLIVPQTLQYVSDVDAAIRNCYAALAPGGVLLLTVPHIQQVYDEEGGYPDRWRFTPAGLRHVLERVCPGADIEVVGRGNLITAQACLLGLAAEELAPAELEVHDPAMVVVVCARVRRPGDR